MFFWRAYRSSILFANESLSFGEGLDGFTWKDNCLVDFSARLLVVVENDKDGLKATCLISMWNFNVDKQDLFQGLNWNF